VAGYRRLNLAGDLAFQGRAIKAHGYRVEPIYDIEVYGLTRLNMGRPVAKAFIHSRRPEIGRLDHMAVG
jgi:hypothetical protein